MTWSTLVQDRCVIQRKWYMNYRSYSHEDGEWGHNAGNIPAPHGDPERVPIPDGVYSFKLFAVAETVVQITDPQTGTSSELVLRSDPLDEGPVVFVKERVNVRSIDQLKSNYKEEDVGELIATMEFQRTSMCLEFPGMVFMPIVADVHFVELSAT